MSEEKGMSRRKYIYAGAGVVVVAAAAGGAYYYTKPAAPPPKGPVTLNLFSSQTGELTTKNGAQTFMDHYEDITVNFESLPWGDPYRDKLAILFSQKQKADVVDLDPAWGFGYMGQLEPLEQFEGAEALGNAMIPAIRESFSDMDGNLTGLPWYAGEISMFYNKKMLADAGFDAEKPQLFKTWDEFAEALIELKKTAKWEGRTVDAPLMFGLAKDAHGVPWIWSTVTASIGKGAGLILDDALNPLFDEGEPAYEAVEWLRKAFLEWEIIHPASLTAMWPQCREAFYGGAVAFIQMRSGYLKPSNDPEVSKIAIPGELNATFSHWPDSMYTATYTEGWCIPRHSEHKDEAWLLTTFQGGKDWNGEFYMPKQYLFDIGRNPPYPEMYEDPEVIADMEKWIDVARLKNQYEKTISMEAQDPVRGKKPWAAEYANLQSTELHNVFTGKTSTRDALDAIAAGLEELKKRD